MDRQTQFQEDRPYFVVLDRQTNNVLGEFDTREEAEALAAELSDGRLVVEEIPA